MSADIEKGVFLETELLELVHVIGYRWMHSKDTILYKYRRVNVMTDTNTDASTFDYKGLMSYDKDLCRFEYLDRPDQSPIFHSDVHLLHGSPPCKDFSGANANRDHTSKRNYGWKQLMSFCEELRPSCFVLENVVNFASSNQGKHMVGLFRVLLKLGYQVCLWGLNSGLFGTSQDRKRWFIVATAPNVALPRTTIPTHNFHQFPQGRSNWKLEGKARVYRNCVLQPGTKLWNEFQIWPVDDGEECCICDDENRKILSAKTVGAALIDMENDQDWEALSDMRVVMKQASKNVRDGTFRQNCNEGKSVYRGMNVLDPNGFSSTIMCQIHANNWSCVLHDRENGYRYISVAEAGALMGFSGKHCMCWKNPIFWKKLKDLGEQKRPIEMMYAMLGNAITPNTTKAIGECLLKSLSKAYPDIDEFNLMHTPLVNQYDHANSIESIHVEMDKLQTGDVLLFYLKGLPACIARNGLSSAWDHVGFVVRRQNYSRALKHDETIPEEQKQSKRKCSSKYCTCYSSSLGEEVELLESTASGCHVYSLEERILRARSHYKIVAVRHLTDFERTKEVQQSIELFISRVRGRAYQYLNMNVIRMALRGGVPDVTSSPSGLPIDRKKSYATTVSINRKLMCSELTAAALQSIGVLSKSAFKCNEFGPTTFSSLDSDDLLSRLAKGNAKYTKEFVFHYPGSPYTRALNDLHLVMKNEESEESTFSFANSIGRMTRISFAKVSPDDDEEETREKRHYSTKEAMEMVKKIRRRKSRLSAISGAITSRFSSFRLALSSSAPP
eukprot:g3038.t1